MPMKKAAQSVFGLIKRQLAQKDDQPPPAAVPDQFDPLAMAQSARMQSLARTRELMGRRTR